jgi:hypothetical protein
MTSNFYSESVKNIFFLNGLVHFELISSTLEDGEIKSVKNGLFVMPMNGFLNLHAQMDQIINKMLDDGLLKRSEDSTLVDNNKKNQTKKL